MKKWLLALLSVLLVAAMVLSFAACGDDKKSKNDDDEEEESVSDTEKDEDEEGSEDENTDENKDENQNEESSDESSDNPFSGTDSDSVDEPSEESEENPVETPEEGVLVGEWVGTMDAREYLSAIYNDDVDAKGKVKVMMVFDKDTVEITMDPKSLAKAVVDYAEDYAQRDIDASAPGYTIEEFYEAINVSSDAEYAQAFADTLTTSFNDSANYTFDESASELAFDDNAFEVAYDGDTLEMSFYNVPITFDRQ